MVVVVHFLFCIRGQTSLVPEQVTDRREFLSWDEAQREIAHFLSTTVSFAFPARVSVTTAVA